MYHVITGNGKGKTTAALGMSLRAAGAGMHVFFAQFVKGKHYAEHNMLKLIPNVEFELMGRTCFIEKDPEQADFDAALAGWQNVLKKADDDDLQMIVLDELHIALYYKLLSIEQVVQFIIQNKNKLEIVSTGRYAPTELLEIADLVSEVQEIKHYYNDGVEAREGIEY